MSFCRCEVENIVRSAAVMRIRTGQGKGRDRQRQTQGRQHFWTDCPQTDASFSHQHGISRLPPQMAFILSVLIVKRLVHIGLNLWLLACLDYRWSETVRRLPGATYTLRGGSFRAQETFTFISEVWERNVTMKSNLTSLIFVWNIAVFIVMLCYVMLLNVMSVHIII